ncbi:MAG: multicopper oxidase family protein [Gemmatimonadota bacterium]|nr:multicopper oxidase family protein [Gemmatimonadota bacterium]
MRVSYVALTLTLALGTNEPPPTSLCDGPARPLAPSRDLYCIELIAAPRIVGASGRVELAMRPGPFTVDVTASGVLRFSPVINLEGLPAPASLGPYSIYVAWVATPVMDPVLRLGEVRNGRAQLPPIALDKFIILVTAEPSAMVTSPTGRFVLRGASPSTRLQPADLMQFTIGATREPQSQSMQHSHIAPNTRSDSARWTMVPMPPNLPMLPAEMTLRPKVAPYLPSADARTPRARPRELIRLGNGDTLRLRAGLVRRSFKDQTLTMFAFNDQYPGPLLEVPQGAEIIVDLTNALDQPTTIHWHGVRLDNRFDGTPDLTQQPVPPGGHFTYRLRFPDAGIYWYHPHVREDVQQELGLYGNMLVRSPRPDYFSPAHREEILMLDDLLINDDGLVPFGADLATHALMGRFGNVLLVNGEPRYSLSVKKGEVVRFYLTNVSNTRTFNLSFPGARIKVVAGDVGNFEREAWVESVVLAPAERYVVQVKFDSAGSVPVLNRVQSLDHLFGKFYYETDTLGIVRVAAEPAERDLEPSFATLREDTATQRDIGRYRLHFGRDPDKSLILAVETQDLPFFTQQMMRLDSIYFTPIEWTGTMPGMNWASTGREVRWVVRDAATGKENMDIDWSFRRGDVVKLRIANERQSIHGMQHPIHVHGQRFLVLAVNDVPTTNRAWKDTVLIPVGFTIDLLLDLSNPGRWMLHCHIAEHLTSMMMMAFTVQ